MKTRRENYLDFVNEWMDKAENKGKSFTMGCALYEFCRGWNGTLSDLGIEDIVNDIIANQSGASYERVEGLNDDAKLEILDISILDELGRQIEEEDEEEQQKAECFEELDSYLFINKDEIIMAIENYFYPTDGNESASYGELAIYSDWADEYIEQNDYELDDEGNIIR